MKGGDTTHAPPEGWLVVAVFHTLWSAGSVACIPSILDLIPIFQDFSSFLSVRADGVGMSSISKELSITAFPTILVLRGGKEVTRLSGADKIAERLNLCLKEQAGPADKEAHAHLLKLQIQRDRGEEDLQYAVDGGDDSGASDWTWDAEKGGKSINILEEGMRVDLIPVDEGMAKWEYSQSADSFQWEQFPVELNRKMERHYLSGALWAQWGGLFGDVQITLGSIDINSFYVKGLTCTYLSSQVQYAVRRYGDRPLDPVPNEDRFLNEKQKQKDIASAAMRKQVAEMKKIIKEEQYGNDVEMVRGSIGIQKDSGPHQWSLRWSHEPARNGSCDSVGICSDFCETYGPAPPPCLGSKDDAGSSIALHADGKVYHNGCVVNFAPGKRFGPITGTATTSSVSESASSALQADGQTSSESPVSVPATVGPFASVFGKGSVVTVFFDSNRGGVLTFSVDSIALDLVIEDVFEMLETDEVFPCLSLCPLDAVGGGDDSTAIPAIAPSDGTGGEISLFPSVTIVPPTPLESPSAAPASTAQETQAPESQESESQPSQESESQPSAASAPVEVEEKIENVRWMYFQNEIWSSYSVEVSKQLEESLRAGKPEITLSWEGTILNFDLGKKVATINNSTDERRLRKHVLKGAPKDMWEMLSVKYEKPFGLTGQQLVKKLEQIWAGGETMDGKAANLGFLFLYSLLAGEVRNCKVLQASGNKFMGFFGGEGDDWAGGGGGGGVGFEGLEEAGAGPVTGPALGGGGFLSQSPGQRGGGGGDKVAGGKATGGQAASTFTESSGNDAHRFGFLLTQLYKDRHSKSLPASVVNVLGRNRQVALRMPLFKDNRKGGSSNGNVFNGWVNETDQSQGSPLADLFKKIVPLMKNMKRKQALKFPPEPPHEELPPTVPKLTTESSAALVGQATEEEFRPELTDYACDTRQFVPVSPRVVESIATMVNHHFEADRLRAEPPIVVEDDEHFTKLTEAESHGRLLALYFQAPWCAPCHSLGPIFHQLALETPTVRFLKVNLFIF